MKVTLKEWAESQKIAVKTAQNYVRRGRLETAVKIGRDWQIEATEPKPKDRRYKD